MFFLLLILSRRERVIRYEEKGTRAVGAGTGLIDDGTGGLKDCWLRWGSGLFGLRDPLFIHLLTELGPRRRKKNGARDDWPNAGGRQQQQVPQLLTQDKLFFLSSRGRHNFRYFSVAFDCVDNSFPYRLKEPVFHKC